MRTLAGLVLTTLALANAGCSAAVFRADFDSDPVGAAPSENPPDRPAGDLVHLSNPGSGSALVVDAPASLTGRSVEYGNVNVPAHERVLGFVSTEIDGRAKHVFASWRGVIAVGPSGSALDVWLGSARSVALASLRFKNGQILRRTGNGPDAFTTIGNYQPGESHTVVMRVDKDTGEYAIRVVGRTVVDTGTHPVLNPTAASTLRPTVYFWFSEDFSSGSTYTIDDVTISTRCPIDDGCP